MRGGNIYEAVCELAEWYAGSLRKFIYGGGGYEYSVVILPVMQTRGYMCSDIDSAVRQHSPMLSLFACL